MLIARQKWNAQAHFAYELGHHPTLNTSIRPPSGLTFSMTQKGEWFSLSEWVRKNGGTIIMGHPLFANHLFSGLLADDVQPAHMTHYEIPINVALKKVDAFELQNNRYSIVNTWMQVWHRLLNCGFRIPISAGTDACASVRTSLPIGIYRSYTQTKDNSLDSYLTGLKKGKSFLTDGPLLFFKADGKGPGETIKTDKDKKQISVSVSIKSIFPVPEAELVQNGKIIKKWDINGSKEFKADCKITVKGSSWLALRVYKRRSFSDGKKETELFAHTNPVYVECERKPIQSSKDALFFLEWTDYALKFRARDESAKKAAAKARRKYTAQLNEADKKRWNKKRAEIRRITLKDFREGAPVVVDSLAKLKKTSGCQHDMAVKISTADIKPGSYYKLSAEVKSSRGKSAKEEGGYTVSKIVIFDSQGNLLGIAEDMSEGGDWASVSTLLYAEKNVRQLQIAYCLESEGASTFKDVVLRKIDGPFFNIVD